VTDTERNIDRLVPGTELTNFPPPELWDDWEEWDAKAWPTKKKNSFRLVPTTCFNCESACGLLAYVDKDSGDVRRFEGNPAHPGSRGRNCAKGPATLNQMYDPERILHPMRRVGERGSGKWEQVSWDTALEEEAGLLAIKDAVRRRDAAEVRRLWGRILERWDGRTFYDFVATSRAFGELSFRHREVFGQVGFGTGGWDSDFPNSMLEVFRVLIAEFEEAQRLIVGGAERLPRMLWAHEPPADSICWTVSASLSAFRATQITFAPLEPRAIATALPSPCDAPVTMATCSLRFAVFDNSMMQSSQEQRGDPRR